MKETTIQKKSYIIMAIVIVLLGVSGMVRHYYAKEPSVAQKYEKPAGDTISVAIEMSPLTYSFANDSAEGFDYELIRDIGRMRGVDFVFHPISQLDRAFAGLDSGKYDMLVASLPSTGRLKDYFPLTDPIYTDRQVLVQRDSAVGSQDQLIGDTIWVADASPYKTRLRNMSRELGDSVYIFSDHDYSQEQLAILTATGKIRHAVVSEAVASRMAGHYPRLNASVPISLTQLQCWAVAPGKEALADSLNVWVAQLKSTPQYKALVKKYFER